MAVRSYLDRMRQIRGGGRQYSATLVDAKTQHFPLKSKNKRRRLSKVVKRSKIATSNPKKAEKRLTMAGARKKKRRARDARGHFVKRKKARKNPVKRRKTRRAAKRRGVTRIKRALGRKKSSGRFTRRAKHRVRGYKRKVRGRRRKKLVRSHLSYERAPRKRRRSRAREEEMSMAAENPRRRRRRSPKRRHARRRAAAENPRPRKRRRARRHAAENPTKRRRGRRRAKRRTATAVMPAIVRRRTRKGGRRTSPATVKVVIAGLGRGGSRSKKRRSSSKRRRGHGRKRSHARKRRKGYTRRTHQLGQGDPQLRMFQEPGFFENPLGGNFMENPLSGGELALAALTGTIGYALADFLDRYLAVRQYIPATVVAGTTPLATTSQAIDTKPSLMRIFAQAAFAAAPLAGAYFVHKPMARAALQGAGLGALVHLGGQLVNHYLMAKLGSSAAPATFMATVNSLYQQENQSDTAATASGLAGLTLGLGSPTRGRIVSRVRIPDAGPRALAAAPGVGNCMTSPGCEDTVCNTPCLANDQTAATAAAASAACGGGSPLVPQPIAVTPPPVSSGSNGSGSGSTTLGALGGFEMFPLD